MTDGVEVSRPLGETVVEGTLLQPSAGTGTGVVLVAGTLHVLHYQLRDPPIPLAGLVLVAPQGRSVGAVGRSQLAVQAALLPDGDALLALYDQAVERFLAGQPMEPDPALPDGVKMLLASLESPANLAFSRELWTTDASPLLAQVDAPVLVLIGKKDIQVSWTDDGAPLQAAAAGRRNVTFAFPEDANHVLEHEPRPLEELHQAQALPAYNADDAVLDRPAADTIVAWLRARTASSRP